MEGEFGEWAHAYAWLSLLLSTLSPFNSPETMAILLIGYAPI